jgi:hypothetical protein
MDNRPVLWKRLDSPARATVVVKQMKTIFDNFMWDGGVLTRIDFDLEHVITRRQDGKTSDDPVERMMAEAQEVFEMPDAEEDLWQYVPPRQIWIRKKKKTQLESAINIRLTAIYNLLGMLLGLMYNLLGNVIIYWVSNVIL